MQHSYVTLWALPFTLLAAASCSLHEQNDSRPDLEGTWVLAPGCTQQGNYYFERRVVFNTTEGMITSVFSLAYADETCTSVAPGMGGEITRNYAYALGDNIDASTWEIDMHRIDGSEPAPYRAISIEGGTMRFSLPQGPGSPVEGEDGVTPMSRALSVFGRDYTHPDAPMRNRDDAYPGDGSYPDLEGVWFVSPGCYPNGSYYAQFRIIVDVDEHVMTQVVSSQYVDQTCTTAVPGTETSYTFDYVIGDELAENLWELDVVSRSTAQPYYQAIMVKGDRMRVSNGQGAGSPIEGEDGLTPMTRAVSVFGEDFIRSR